MIPGVSRAGATILGGELLGVDRRIATEFSFYLAIPTMLGATVLDLYKARGEVLLYEDETFQNDDWLSLFIGHGLMPDAWDPRIDMLPEDQLILHVQKLLGFIRDQVQAMDSHDAYIELFAARSFAGFGSQL